MKGVIYSITNKVNGKLYIGRTTEKPNKYWNMHKNRALNGWKKVLYDAIRKYGVDNFDFDIIKEVEANNYNELNEELNKLEILLISELDTVVPNGYNITIGGEGSKGVKRDDDFRENLRKIKLGVPRPDWVKAKLRNPKTEEHKQKLRKPKTEEHKEKLRQIWESFSEEKRQEIFSKGVENRRSYDGEDNPFYGKTHSVEFVEWITKHNAEYQNREDVKLNNKMKQPHRISVKMIDPKTNKVKMTFLSVGDATKWIAENTDYKGDKGTISKAIKSGKVSYGYKWIKDDD